MASQNSGGCGMRGNSSYTLSILQAMLSRFGHKLRVAIDGKEYTGTYMMAAICNGGYYGGGYQAAPYAAMDDGLLDIVLVKPISRIQVAGIWPNTKPGSICRMPIPSCRSSAAL